MAGYFDSLQDAPESSEEEFLKEQLAGSAPQYDPEGGWNTAKGLGKLIAEMTTPGAMASAAGYMGDPSLFQNIGSGDYGTAALQAAGLIPGIGWAGKAGKLGKAARSAEVISPSAMREIGATPRGWDIAGPRRAPPMIEGGISEVDPFFGVQRTDRTKSWEGPKTKWPEPRLSPYEEIAPPMAAQPAAPKTRLAKNYVSDIPLASYTDYSPRISGDMNPNVADLLRKLRAEDAAPNRFEQAMLDRYYSGRQGQAVMEAMNEMPVSVIPRNIQRTLASVNEQNRPLTSLERANLKKHFAGRTGLQSRAALSGQQMREAVSGPQAQFRQAMMEEMGAAPEVGVLETPPSGREGLLRRALNIASNIDPKVAAKATAGGLGAMGAYLASRNAGEIPPAPAAGREERPHVSAAVSPIDFPAWPMEGGPMGTDFDTAPKVARDRPERVVPPPSRPAKVSESRPSPGRKETERMTRAAPKRAAPARAARSSQRYYGDWRDTEPFASDPIGGFIDELTGRTRQSTRKGSLGDLGYDKGGSVRRPFADGGTEDRIPVLSDIGDALGGLFEPSEGGERVVAADRAPMSSAKNFFEDWSTNPLSQFLFAAGLGTMASDRVNPLQAVGEGGLRGLEYMQAVSANQQALRREREAAAERRRQLDYLRGIMGPSAETQAAPPVKTSSAEPESTTAETPVKVAGAETTAPEATPQETAAPVVAQDSKLRNLYSIEDKLTNALASMTDPQARQTASAALQSVKSRISRVESQKRETRLAEQATRTADIQERRLQKEIETSSPEYRQQLEREKVQADIIEKQSADRRKQAQDADAKIATLNRMKEGLVSGKIDTGTGAEAELALKKAAIPTGFVDEEAVALTEQFAKDAGGLVMAAANGSLGVGISSTDRDYLASLQPGMSTSKKGNIKVIDAAIKVEERKKQIAELERDYRKRHNGALDLGFDEELSKWAKENPIRPEDGKSSSKSTYTGPIITGEGGKRMRLSDDKKSWVPF